MSALHALAKDKEALLIVLSSDHIISNEFNFLKLLSVGLIIFKKGKLVTFGVVPDRPETGYGYIKVDQIVDINNPVGTKIIQFLEKPNLNDAEKFVEDGKYFWNSGIFMFKASVIIEEFKKLSEQNAEFIKTSYEKSKKRLRFSKN